MSSSPQKFALNKLFRPSHLYSKRLKIVSINHYYVFHLIN